MADVDFWGRRDRKQFSRSLEIDNRPWTPPGVPHLIDLFSLSSRNLTAFGIDRTSPRYSCILVAIIGRMEVSNWRAFDERPCTEHQALSSSSADPAGHGVVPPIISSEARIRVRAIFNSPTSNVPVYLLLECPLWAIR
jgi:hypothetical protein